MCSSDLDPYHDYYRSSSDLNKFIAAKYGSVANAQNQVLYYRNDWAATSGDQLSKSVYNNLDESIKKYYKPIIDNTNNIVAYERIEEDWTKSTNKIQELTVSNTTPFVVGEKILQQSSGATAYVANVDDNTVTVQHIEGAFEVSNTITQIATITQVIPDEEAVFWTKVTAYDKILEDNEVSKSITLVKKSYVDRLEKSFIKKVKKK